MRSHLSIDDRRVGPGEPVLVIAELSANHRGRLDEALELVEAAHRAGADAIKLQTYTADTLTIDCDASWFRVPSDTQWAGRTLHELYREAFTPWPWHAELQRAARARGIICFSTPFDPTAVAFLAGLNMPAYKIASFELVDHGLLAEVARQSKPIILSTGMATLEEIDEAVGVLEQHGARELALLKCTSAYPAPAEEMQLRGIVTLAERYGLPVGLSDHTLDSTAAIASVALGASIVEKHLTLSRAAGGPDAAFSLEPAEFAELVRVIRRTEASLGEAAFACGPREAASRVFRRSLFVVADMQADERFTQDNVRSIRPGHGLPPKYLPQIVGRRASRALARGTPLAWEMIQGCGR